MRAWVNGQLLPTPDTAAISVLDHGMIVGDGVFETVAVRDQTPFALTRHLNRLVTSAEGLGIGRPDVEQVRDAIAATIDGQQLTFGRIRITVTSGPGPLGSPRGDSGLTYTVITEPAEEQPATSTIVTVPWPRNERGALAGLKTTSYAENAKVVEYARARGASEGVMPNTLGQLCEGTGSNIFYVVDGALITPTLESGCLAGVTRALVLQWCAGELDVVEQDAPMEVLKSADEVMLVGTTRDVQGITRVDDRELPAGPLTARAREIFIQNAAEQPDP